MSVDHIEILEYDINRLSMISNFLSNYSNFITYMKLRYVLFILLTMTKYEKILTFVRTDNSECILIFLLFQWNSWKCTNFSWECTIKRFDNVYVMYPTSLFFSSSSSHETITQITSFDKIAIFWAVFKDLFTRKGHL